MSNNTVICSKLIRKDETGLYSLNDLHKASGNHKNHQPSNFLRQSTTKELIEEISSSSDMRVLSMAELGLELGHAKSLFTPTPCG
ncbi:kilA-N domain protein [Vibrio phage VaK]|nr:kilA-N domain protein [Vibrio phage VaK]